MEKICISIVLLLSVTSTMGLSFKPGYLDGLFNNSRLENTREYKFWCNTPECHDLHAVEETEAHKNAEEFRFIHCSSLFEILIVEINRLKIVDTHKQARELPFSPNFCPSSSEVDSTGGALTSTTSNYNEDDLIIDHHMCMFTSDIPCPEEEEPSWSSLYWILVVAGLAVVVLFSVAVNIWQHYAKKRAVMQYRNFGSHDGMLTELQIHNN